MINFAKCIAGLLALAFASTVQADAWPIKPVRIVIPYSAGGGLDHAARLLAEKLTSVFGQNFLVDPRPGGATIVGTKIVADSAPDGYTLLVTGSSTMSILPLTHPEKLPFDTTKDFAPIAMISRMPFFIVSSAELPYKKLGDLVAAARAKPGELGYAINGVGSIGHLGFARWSQSAGVEMIDVPYKGFSAALPDVIAGRVAVTMADLGAMKGLVDSGKMRVLAVSSGTRSTFLPSVPTLAEAGYPGNEFEVWIGLFAPAGTPSAIVKAVESAMKSYLTSEEARTSYAVLGQVPDPVDGGKLQQRIKDEIAGFGPVAAKAGFAPKR